MVAIVDLVLNSSIYLNRLSELGFVAKDPNTGEEGLDVKSQGATDLLSAQLVVVYHSLLKTEGYDLDDWPLGSTGLYKCYAQFAKEKRIDQHDVAKASHEDAVALKRLASTIKPTRGLHIVR